MSQWVQAGVRSAYMKIAEPRVIRLIQFAIYVCLFVVGGLLLNNIPTSLAQASGKHVFVIIFGLMLMIGAFCSGIAVLPGIWWLERSGLVLLGSALLIYMVMITRLNTSPMGFVVCLILILTFVQRWLEIKGAALAPLLPKKRG